MGCFRCSEARIHSGRDQAIAVGSPASEVEVSLEEFCRVAEDLNARNIVGRFSTFPRTRQTISGRRACDTIQRLFHWGMPRGREVETGGEVGPSSHLTHCYWREAGTEFKNVNIMAVTHGTDKRLLVEHKAAIDQHLRARDIPVSTQTCFWGGRNVSSHRKSRREFIRWLSEQGKSSTKSALLSRTSRNT